MGEKPDLYKGTGGEDCGSQEIAEEQWDAEAVSSTNRPKEAAAPKRKRVRCRPT